MIYFIQAQAGDRLIKIGKSVEPMKRFISLAAMCPVPFEVISVIDGDTSIESLLHMRFSADRVRGEWFFPSSDLCSYLNTLPVYDPDNLKLANTDFIFQVARDKVARKRILINSSDHRDIPKSAAPAVTKISLQSLHEAVPLDGVAWLDACTLAWTPVKAEEMKGIPPSPSGLIERRGKVLCRWNKELGDCLGIYNWKEAIPDHPAEFRSKRAKIRLARRLRVRPLRRPPPLLMLEYKPRPPTRPLTMEELLERAEEYRRIGAEGLPLANAVPAPEPKP